MVVSEEKLKNLIASTQEPIFCDAMNLWEIQHSLVVLHAILAIYNNRSLEEYHTLNQQEIFLGLEAILAQANNRIEKICDKGMTDFQGAINVHAC